MHTLPRRLRLATATATVVLAPLTLGACDQLAENAVERGVEEAVENGAGEDVEVDLDADGDGNVKVETSDGTFQTGSELPDDYPIEEVPIVGEVSAAASSSTGAGRRWTIATTLGGSVEDALTEAKSALEAAGFTTDGEAAGAFISLTNDTYSVVASAGDDGSGGVSLSYVVSEVS